MYSPPVCVSEVDVLLAVAPDALNLPRFLRRVVPVNKTRRHTSYPYRRLKETYQHVPHFSSPSVPPVHKTRVVIRVAHTRTEITHKLTDAHEPSDFDWYVPGSFALGRAEVLSPPSVCDVAVVALAQAGAEAEVASLLLQVSLRRPRQVSLVVVPGRLRAVLILTRFLLFAKAERARDGG